MPTKKKTVKRVAVKRKVTRAAKKVAAPKLPRITYATLTVTADDDKAYDAAVEKVHGELGKHFSNFVNGAACGSSAGENAHHSPVDTRIVVSYFPKGTRDDTRSAIQAAREAYAKWSALDYRDRVTVLRCAADLIIERRFELSAWMAYEVGKNRAESLAEVNETAELIRYYCERMEYHKGFTLPLEAPAAGQKTVSVLRPYGVWAVIAPWNFPMALATGMSAGALVAGNTVVFKPSSESTVIGYEIYRAFADAGVPDGVFNLMVGPGSTVGNELQENPGVDALIFTGSADVGMRLYKNFASKFPKPVIAEMGGKNPAIITASANLDEAAEGVMRAAFGFDGQKCSACSRVYVDNSVKEKFLSLLIGYTQSRIRVGDPTKKETFMGPVINRAAVDLYLQAVDDVRRSGGKFHYGGRRINEAEFKNGYFVEPVIAELPKTHRLFQDELFLPFLVVTGVDSFDEAMTEANNSQYGLCAGIYSHDRNEIDYFFDHIQAGVTYSNRRAGATTGAWPGVNSFGGWKGSGSTGKSALGPYYVQQFMREQSRWIVESK
ncbi:MAG: aldehyde dehydrogenase family protein [Chloroflexi bacterium]|nr:aldehyde dehydrogenase family protein [Chloroflexota bacterium]